MKEVHLDVSVTALGVLDSATPGKKLILAGIGGNVELYEWYVGDEKHGRLLQRMKIFQGVVIHGLVIRQSLGEIPQADVLVFGGKKLASIRIDAKSGRFHVTKAEKTLGDWIIHSSWIDTDEILTLSAHNRVARLSIDSSSQNQDREWICPENCILYSGLILDKDTSCTEETIILSGTVFQEVVVWCLSDDSPILHRLEGHEGVIFSINFDPTSRRICSTSDDRTARIWQVGFEESDSKIFWSKSRITCTHILRQHVARVFRSAFVNSNVVTCGEDSKLIVWDDKGQMKLQKTIHDGSPIWSVVPMAYQCQQIVLTGGGNSSIVFSLLDKDLNPEPLEVDTSFLTCNDYPKVVKLFQSWTLFLTQCGHVYCHKRNCHKLLLYNGEFRNYALMEVQSSRLIIGTIHGEVFAYKIREQDDNLVLVEDEVGHCRSHFKDQKIFSLHAFRSGTDDPSIVTSSLKGDLVLDNVKGEKVRLKLEGHGEQHCVSCADFSDSNILYIGDRGGNLHAYELSSGRRVSLSQAHGKFGIGDIRISEDAGTLWTVGRDGMLKVHSYNRDNATLETVSSQKMRISWMERILDFKQRQLILGFEGSDFVVLESEIQNVLMRISCGGSHRSWDLSLEAHPKFVFIKDKRLYFADIKLEALSPNVIRPSQHSKEINVLKHFRLLSQDFLVSAGEDGRVWIDKINLEPGFGRETVAVVKSHISSVKGIDLKSQTESRVEMVTGGGRAQLKTWVLSANCVNDQICIRETNTYNLFGSEKRRKKTWRDSQVIGDSEIRITDVTFGHLASQIFVSGSDGKVRVLLEEKGRLRPSGQSQSANCCLLNINIIKSNEDVCELITGGTNGHCQIWHWVFGSEEIVLKQNVPIHGSGVNSICGEGDRWFSGSDGGAIAVLSRLGNACIIGEILLKAAHSAQVTGIAKIGDKVITSSIDQRLSVWRLRDGGGLELLKQSFFGVSDPQTMTVWKCQVNEKYFAAVAGNGLVFYDLDYI